MTSVGFQDIPHPSIQSDISLASIPGRDIKWFEAFPRLGKMCAVSHCHQYVMPCQTVTAEHRFNLRISPPYCFFLNVGGGGRSMNGDIPIDDVVVGRCICMMAHYDNMPM